ncbi:MAG: transglutaminase TgpA family protein [Burkholderiales bacterium]
MNALPHPLAPELRAVSGRDLAALIASLLLVVAPHAEHAPWWIALLVLSLYGWRVYLGVTHTPLPPHWLLLALTGAAMAGIWAQYHTIFGRSPGIVLLCLFSGLKLLEMRSRRDATVVAFLCFFLIITNFFYSQSIPTALTMCVALAAITTTLVGFAAPQRRSQANLRTAGLLLAHAAPAALVLFLLFPRVQGPLWGLPQEASAGISGLSDTMSPGNLARLALSDATAFRVEFQGKPPPPQLRYWRGPVLWDFDGRNWRMGPTILADFKPPHGGDHIYRYSVVLEPHNRNWLFALETAASLPPGSRYTEDGQILARRPVRQRIRYELESVTDPVPEAAQDPGALRRALRLPEGFDPRSVALAHQWRDASRSDAAIVARAINFLRVGGYVYTLEPPRLGVDSVDEFLFDTKAGFCEHFASAFVFLMRAAGVPARVVIGYQGGDVNPVDRIVTVRQSDAHAWAEVYLRARGWVRVDPTAAAVPGRIASGLARTLPEGEPLPLLMRPQLQWLRSLRYQWEALSYKWNIWVLGYDPQRQRELMSLVGMRDADWRKLTATLFTILGLFTAMLLVWSLRRLVRPDPVQKTWQAFCRKLGARGIERSPTEGPRDYSERAARDLPQARGAIRCIGELYVALRYGAAAPPERIDELRHLVRDLRLS